MIHASSELSEHVFQSASFLYIVVLCQPQLVGLGRFQYYLDCDHMFDLFNYIEVYTCEVSLFLSQLTLKSRLQPIELYSLCHEVKNPLINLLCSMSRDSLHKLCSVSKNFDLSSDFSENLST